MLTSEQKFKYCNLAILEKLRYPVTKLTVISPFQNMFSTTGSITLCTFIESPDKQFLLPIEQTIITNQLSNPILDIQKFDVEFRQFCEAAKKNAIFDETTCIYSPEF